MAELNAAYSVLVDPARRAEYDAALRATPPVPPVATAPAPAVPARRVEESPARVPWKLMAVMATAGSAVVLVGAALYEPSGPTPADGVLHVGSCVAVVERDQTAREITCTDDATHVVADIVPAGESCGSAGRPYRDVLRGDTICVTPRTA